MAGFATRASFADHASNSANGYDQLAQRLYHNVGALANKPDTGNNANIPR